MSLLKHNTVLCLKLFMVFFKSKYKTYSEVVKGGSREHWKTKWLKNCRVVKEILLWCSYRNCLIFSHGKMRDFKEKKIKLEHFFYFQIPVAFHLLPESKMIEKHGGYKFTAPVVPSTFNFGGTAPGMNWVIYSTFFFITLWLIVVKWKKKKSLCCSLK